ncbi:zinc finger protein 536 isoform X1 [Tachysurus ichikawai]
MWNLKNKTKYTMENTGEFLEWLRIPGKLTMLHDISQRPFQCQYCSYSASQKGNLKTHVLCVHRMPFDNSQYPDRRFKRSRIESDASGSPEDGYPLLSGQGGTGEGYAFVSDTAQTSSKDSEKL